MSDQQQIAAKHDNVSHWAERWVTGQTGWHIEDLNPVIASYAQQWLGEETDSAKPLKVMFPLCGKTVDMKHLAAKGYECYGIEGVQLAIDDYAKEQGVVVTEEAPLCEGLRTLKLGGDATVFFGDFFSWPHDAKAKEDAPIFDRVFDRGSLVAILPEKRKEYVRIINSMLPVGGRWLVTSMGYPQEEKPGAPHSVTEEDLAALLSYLKEETGAEYSMEVLQKEFISPETIDDSFPLVRSRFLKSKGGPISSFTEFVFLVKKVSQQA